MESSTLGKYKDHKLSYWTDTALGTKDTEGIWLLSGRAHFTIATTYKQTHKHSHTPPPLPLPNNPRPPHPHQALLQWLCNHPVSCHKRPGDSVVKRGGKKRLGEAERGGERRSGGGQADGDGGWWRNELQQWLWDGAGDDGGSGSTFSSRLRQTEAAEERKEWIRRENSQCGNVAPQNAATFSFLIV